MLSSSKTDLGLLVISFWSPQPIGCLKINFDVVFSSSSHEVNLGLIFKYANGGFLYALVELGFSSNSVLIAEYLAAKAGLIKALFYGTKVVVLEGDYKEIFKSSRTIMSYVIDLLSI